MGLVSRSGCKSAVGADRGRRARGAGRRTRRHRPAARRHRGAGRPGVVAAAVVGDAADPGTSGVATSRRTSARPPSRWTSTPSRSSTPPPDRCRARSLRVCPDARQNVSDTPGPPDPTDRAESAPAPVTVLPKPFPRPGVPVVGGRWSERPRPERAGGRIRPSSGSTEVDEKVSELMTDLDWWAATRYPNADEEWGPAEGRHVYNEDAALTPIFHALTRGGRRSLPRDVVGAARSPARHGRAYGLAGGRAFHPPHVEDRAAAAG